MNLNPGDAINGQESKRINLPCSLNPVNHSDTGQSWALVNEEEGFNKSEVVCVKKRRRLVSELLVICVCNLWLLSLCRCGRVGEEHHREADEVSNLALTWSDSLWQRLIDCVTGSGCALLLKTDDKLTRSDFLKRQM